ncbi:MAG: hypothetical protein NT154_32630 [Verrucomicrobia bacterium]|nr:hypothetical protein [Verrucomicrobiota bacterium]
MNSESAERPPPSVNGRHDRPPSLSGTAPQSPAPPLDLPAAALPDATLVQQAQAGDDESLNVIISRHLPSFRRHAELLCDDPTEAQDICQDALAKAT